MKVLLALVAIASAAKEQHEECTATSECAEGLCCGEAKSEELGETLTRCSGENDSDYIDEEDPDIEWTFECLQEEAAADDSAIKLGATLATLSVLISLQ